MVGLILAEAHGSFYAVGGVALACGAAITGLFFRGAAEAWRSERDAAVDKANRLEEDGAAERARMEKRITELETQVEALKLTNVEHLTSQNAIEHKHIVEALQNLSREVQHNTTAVEFLIKQAFPTAVLPVLGGEL